MSNNKTIPKEKKKKKLRKNATFKERSITSNNHKITD